MTPFSRRRWLAEASLLATLPHLLWSLEADEELVDFADADRFKVEIQPSHPRVKAFDLRTLANPIPPTEDFFVFHQTTVPEIDPLTWKLTVGGALEKPVTLTLPDLSRRPQQDLEFAIECSGNMPRPDTLNGQIGNARWRGINLASLLNACGLKADAREVVFFAADHIYDAAGKPVRPYGRSVFIQDALHEDAILATEMNGRPLSPEHGFPVRLILPGWYGMAQVKWLTRIEVIDRRYEGLQMSRNYHTFHALESGGDPLIMETSISRTRLKSVVARVSRRRRSAAWSYRVGGIAWGGTTPIDRVEIKVDSGAWQPTRLERRGKYAWQPWSFDWGTVQPGPHTLTSRAIDRDGRLQPTSAELTEAIRSARENHAQWERSIVIPA